MTRTLTDQQKNWLAGAFLAALALAMLVALRLYYPIGIDWETTYHKAVRNIDNPYEPSSFAGFPWLLFMLPHALLSMAWGNAINFFLNLTLPMLYIWRHQGGWQAMLIVFLSPLFLDLTRTNNVDWIPLLAFLLPATVGLPLLAAKPQTVGGAALVWWKKRRFSLTMLVPTIVIVLVSAAIWGGQYLERMQEFNLREVEWNFAPFPFFIPIGLYLLYQGFKKEDEVLAATGTPFLVPYFAPYSLVPLLTLLACKYRREALFVNLGFWWYFIVSAHRMELLLQECVCP